jgi:hypothetical protein
MIGLLAWAALPVAGQEAAQAHTTTAHKPSSSAPVVRSSLHHATSRAVRELPTLANDAKFQARSLQHQASLLRGLPLSAGASATLSATQTTDAVRQPAAPLAPAALAPPVAGLGFDGIGVTTPGFIITDDSPDTNGAAGTTQYVQFVNRAFAIFDKSTGTLLAGPTAGNQLWTGIGDDCEVNNDGQPIVMFDKIASRWVFAQISTSTAPNLACVAVSTTADATGTYNLYSFSYPNVTVDSPKLGVWPDAYYASFNMFDPTTDPPNAFLGADICAYDSTAMLAGTPATQICFQQDPSVSSVLPSDFDGTILPPTGAPNYAVALGATSLNLFQFHVDFTTPANSTFTGPTAIPVAAYTPLCNGAGVCIPQKQTSNLLFSAGDRLMYRAAYRNFGTHESLVVNHSVAASTSGGIRWYEVQNPGGTPVLAQQSTFAPNSSYRWMGSIAMDQSGDMGLGYSVSDSTINPGIAFTGRTTADPANTMETETAIIAGAGSQAGPDNGWGNYSAMQLDPSDDCTFWYTNEYLQMDGASNWSTRIASFKFPNCGKPPDFSLSASPASLSIFQGTSGTTTISVADINNFNGSVTLSASGLPAGVTAVFTPASTTSSSTLQLTASGTAATGTSTITITGTSGALTESTTMTLTVNGPPPDYTLSATPASLAVVQGTSGTSTIAVNQIHGFSGSVALTASGLPAGVTATFNPASTTTTSNLVFTASSTATTGPATITVTGVSGALTHTTTITLTVNVPSPDFSLSASPSSLSVAQNGTGVSTITIARINGFNSTVALSASGLPTGVTAAFNPASATTTSTLTLTVSGTATPGTATITVTGTSGTIIHTTTVTLTINANVLGNPGFENGTSTAPWVLTAGVINRSSLEPPHSGIWDAWLGGHGSVHTDTATQPVSIASTATSATLSFWMHIDTAETATTVHDKLQVQVLNTAGTVLATLGAFSNLDHATGYQTHSFNLIAFKGQNIQIRFVSTEDGSLQTSFVLDDTSLVVF